MQLKILQAQGLRQWLTAMLNYSMLQRSDIFFLEQLEQPKKKL